MSVFITVHNTARFEHGDILVWGECRNLQQRCDLLYECMQREIPMTTPIHLHDTRGSGSGSLYNLLFDCKNNLTYSVSGPFGSAAMPVPDSGDWVKEPKWKQVFRGLAFLGGYQKGAWAFWDKKKFKKWMGFEKDSEQGIEYCHPIPSFWLESKVLFGPGRKCHTADDAVKMIVQAFGPSKTWNENEIKMRLFGRVNDNPYSTSKNSQIGREPENRIPLELHVYTINPEDGNTHVQYDFWEFLQEFYGTNSLKEMKKLNMEGN